MQLAMKNMTLSFFLTEPCTDLEGGGGGGGGGYREFGPPPPHTGKSQVIWVSIGI